MGCRISIHDSDFKDDEQYKQLNQLMLMKNISYKDILNLDRLYISIYIMCLINIMHVRLNYVYLLYIIIY